MTSLLTGEFAAFIQILLIDLSLAADNAIIVGMAAAGLPLKQRRLAILYGVLGATTLRIIFALFTTQMLQILGLTLIGGILLIWVCWKMYRQIRTHGHEAHVSPEGEIVPDQPVKTKTLKDATIQIIVADVSMSLDNVLAVAGAAHGHPTWVLVAGLALSIILMAVASNFVVKLLERFKWLAWLGLLVVFYIACKMIWHGSDEVLRYFGI